MRHWKSTHIQEQVDSACNKLRGVLKNVSLVLHLLPTQFIPELYPSNHVLPMGSWGEVNSVPVCTAQMKQFGWPAPWTSSVRSAGSCASEQIYLIVSESWIKVIPLREMRMRTQHLLNELQILIPRKKQLHLQIVELIYVHQPQYYSPGIFNLDFFLKSEFILQTYSLNPFFQFWITFL